MDETFNSGFGLYESLERRSDGEVLLIALGSDTNLHHALS